MAAYLKTVKENKMIIKWMKLDLKGRAAAILIEELVFSNQQDDMLEQFTLTGLPLAAILDQEPLNIRMQKFAASKEDPCSSAKVGEGTSASILAASGFCLHKFAMMSPINQEQVQATVAIAQLAVQEHITLIDGSQSAVA